MIEEKYADMYELPHHISKKHPQMSVYNRAAQFAPFAALTGFEGCIDEEARLTDAGPENYEEKLKRADEVLSFLKCHENEHPLVNIRYFVRDIIKDGGAYKEIKGKYKRLDENGRRIYLTDGSFISVDDISEIDAEGMRDDFTDN